ncbi:expansin-A22-like [Syzygium oleosum]|uniref:expansin-A22-like n=1 Tax=Syzygium oleosum TaxID=219896 RepID=UPI0024B8E08D|nr:expansin-A22-like [Syzygium oleosum]
MAVYKVSLILAMAVVVSAIDSNWYDAHATFYGDMGGQETMQGACGYGDLFKQGYGLETAALSTALFNDGLSCGACFKIYCTNAPQSCIPNAGSIIITATNFCPPNYTIGKQDAWCNPPQKHFDLSMKMFTTIAYYKAGIIPVRYRRVLCSKQGGVKFEINGNPYFTLVLIYNVGGAGDVNAVNIKGSNTQWIAMTHNWGQNWQTGTVLTGQSLSFQVTISDGTTLEFDNAAPAEWQFGQTYDGGKNF